MEEKESFPELKRKRNVSCSEIMFKGKAIGSNAIFVNEQLSSINSKIFYLARGLKKKGLVLHAWVRNGVVYVCEDENKKSIRVSHKDQLQQFIRSKGIDEMPPLDSPMSGERGGLVVNRPKAVKPNAASATAATATATTRSTRTGNTVRSK